jgi:hypothetical protein
MTDRAIIAGIGVLLLAVGVVQLIRPTGYVERRFGPQTKWTGIILRINAAIAIILGIITLIVAAWLARAHN